MTTIVIDEAGSMPVGEVLRQATGNLIELRSESGALIATVHLAAYPTEEDYAEAVARAESDLDELRRRRARPADEFLSLKQLMAKLTNRQQ